MIDANTLKHVDLSPKTKLKPFGFKRLYNYALHLVLAPLAFAALAAPFFLLDKLLIQKFSFDYVGSFVSILWFVSSLVYSGAVSYALYSKDRMLDSAPFSDRDYDGSQNDSY